MDAAIDQSKQERRMNILLDFLPFMYDGRTRGIWGVASFAKSF